MAYREINVVHSDNAQGVALILDNEDVYSFYAIKGSHAVACCRSVLLTDGCNIEAIRDVERFDSKRPIHSFSNLEDEVSTYLA